MNDFIPFLPGLSPVAGKELCARFDGGRLSSNGGLLLFPRLERRLGISDLLASCVNDDRDPASTTHAYADMTLAGTPEQVSIDTTHVKAHRCAGGGKGGLLLRPSGVPKADETPRSMP